MGLNPSTVVVALSGGVDSSLSAALLKRAGWEVTGLHLLLPVPPIKKRAKIDSVQRVAEHLQISLYFFDLQEEFTRKVIDPFTTVYLSGLTPNPCVLCNESVKFEQLLGYAHKNGIDFVATGHYANVKDSEGSPVELWRGRDKRKEQSYFLHRLRQSHLSGTLLPLGEFTKKEVRVLAEEMGLPTASEPESQEICFLPENDYRSFLEEKMGMEIFRKGDIIDGDGHKLGDHYGSYGFTIGQRHGLGISSLRPYYVKKIIPENNQIVAGRKEELFSKHVEAESFNWISGAPPENGIKVVAQIRYRHRAAPGLLEILSSDRVRFQFDEPQWAITPGQALVCYEGDRLLGGGWIL